MTTLPERLRVLIVEDSADDALLIAERLEQEGLQLDWQRVDTEEGVLAALQAFAPEVVLADHRMPRLSSWRVLELVSGQGEVHPPVVVVSGAIGEEIAADLLRAGAYNFVAKDHLARLVPVVVHALEELRLRTEREAAERALALSERRHRAFVTASAQFTWRLTPDGGLIDIDQAWLDMVGLTREQADGLGWLDAIHPEDRTAFWRAMKAAFAEASVFETEYRLVSRDGWVRWFEDRAVPVRDVDGEIVEWTGSTREVTAEVRLEAERRKLSRALAQAADAIIITDAQRRIEYVNPAFERITGYSASEVMGRDPIVLRSEETDPAVLQRLRDALAAGKRFHGVLVNRRRNGALYFADMSVAPVRDDAGTITHFIASHYDVTDKLRTEQELSWLVTHDPVTKVANRTLIVDRLDQLLSHHWPDECQVAVAHVDIDHFGLINDSWGSTGGDRVLRIVAERLAAAAGDTGAVGRIGNDGFAVVKAYWEEDEHIEDWPAVLSAALAEPIELGGDSMSVSATMGVAVGPGDADGPEALLRCAETAMHRARDIGTGEVAFYAPAMTEEAQRWLAIERDLKAAVEEEQFHLAYQPQVDLRTGRMIGAEALLRWQHPERGPVSPGEFIPMLERTGLIVSVGEWVIREACRQVRQWLDRFPKVLDPTDFRVAVNLSLKQFRRRDLADVVQEALAVTGADPRSLELELTESSIADDPGEAARQLASLRELGVAVAVDDFGTGYSSLSYLQQLPIDVVKIDRAFINGVTRNPGDAAILRAVVAMAEGLGMRTIAEGVEGEDQLAFLAAESCHIVQGFYYARPMPAADFDVLLESGGRFQPLFRAVDTEPSVVLLMDDGPCRTQLADYLGSRGVSVFQPTSRGQALETLAVTPNIGVAVVGAGQADIDSAETLQHASQLHPGVIRMLVVDDSDAVAIIQAVNQGCVEHLLHTREGVGALGEAIMAGLDIYRRGRQDSPQPRHGRPRSAPAETATAKGDR